MQPNLFISNSDFASTPAPLAGSKTIDLTTPANVSVGALQTKMFIQQVQFDEPFDTVDFVLTCDEFPDIVIYNGYYYESDLTDLFVSVEISGTMVSLVAVFTNFFSATFPSARHFHAKVVPMKSPFNQS